MWLASPRTAVAGPSPAGAAVRTQREGGRPRSPARPSPETAACSGSDLTQSTERIRPITAAARELDGALSGSLPGLRLPRHRRARFRSRCGADLAAGHPQLRHGRGLVTACTEFPSRATTKTICAGSARASTHLGVARYRNVHGRAIGEVRDEFAIPPPVEQPGARETVAVGVGADGGGEDGAEAAAQPDDSASSAGGHGGRSAWYVRRRSSCPRRPRTL